MRKSDCRRCFTVMVFDREKDGDSVFSIKTKVYFVAKLCNFWFQRILRAPRYTTVCCDIERNTVIHFKSDL